MPRVVHFEIHADKTDRAAKFYRSLFDWKISRWDGPQEYWLVNTGEGDEPGINGAIMSRRGEKYEDMAVIGYVCTVQVDDVDSYVRKAVDLGGTLAVEKMTIPGVGYSAYIKDPEGNIFGLHQVDESAG